MENKVSNRVIITLTTDFGLADHFVGVLKGVILNINPEVEIVDLCHQVTSFDIVDGAFTLAQGYRYFPPQTIHLVVVDPGVGTSRRAIAVLTQSYRFVGPDNGVLSLIYDREAAVRVYQITAERYYLHPVSSTFHGRDIFAPIAAWLSKGVSIDEFGELITDYVRFTPPKPQQVNAHHVKGVTLRVDRFGNLITNLTTEDVAEVLSENPRPFRIVINGQEITQVHSAFAAGKPNELFAILGSSGYLEICAYRNSASKLLQAGPGMEVEVHLGAEGAMNR